jgi:hypothetical protein
VTLYARSDIQALALSGVDHTHRRPNRRDGSPVRVWELNCGDCESHLDDDVLWSKTRHKVPLTDEEKQEQEELSERANAAMERERLEQARRLAEGVRREQQEDEPDEDDKPVNSDRPDQPQDDGDKDMPEHEAPEYTSMSYNELQAEIKRRGLQGGGKKEDLIQRLADDDDRPSE